MPLKNNKILLHYVPHGINSNTFKPIPADDKALKNHRKKLFGDKQYDFVLITTPFTDSSIPLMAPAALKPIVEQAGLSCLAVDLNAEVYHYTRDHELKEDLIKFFFDERGTPAVVPVTEKLHAALNLFPCKNKRGALTVRLPLKTQPS